MLEKVALIALSFCLAQALMLSDANAKVKLNSMCYEVNRAGESLQGVNVSNKYPIASVSKVVTSYLAVSKLGPSYRFATTLNINKVGPDLYDVHITGGRDPMFGRDMTSLVISELNKANVQNIRKLSFDENFYYFYSVQNKPEWSIHPNSDQIAQFLKARMKVTSDYLVTTKIAKEAGIKLAENPKIKIGDVSFLSKNDFKSDRDTRRILILSLPLAKTLKFMNRVSNNFIADHLFLGIGGVETARQFLKDRLDLNSDEIAMINGSGDSIVMQDPIRGTYKLYNESACSALVEIVMSLRKELKQYKMDLEDVMAVSGDERSTLGGRYAGESTSDAVVAKTGSVNPAITLAGMLSTQSGDVYFGVLYKTDGPADWSSARNQIREKIGELMKKYGGKRELDYDAMAFLPFDRQSVKVSAMGIQFKLSRD